MTSELPVLIVHHPTNNPVRPLKLPAMGLLSLAEYLTRHQIDTQVVNLEVEWRLDPGFDILAYASERRARILGLSLQWFFQLPDTLSLAAAAKERLGGDVLVVLGGFTASYFCDEIIRQHPAVDVIVRGDGEVPFLQLAKLRLSDAHADISTVPNLVFRNDAGDPAAAPFTHVVNEQQLGGFNFSRLELMKNHEHAFFKTMVPTKRFKERFRFTDDGWFLVETGRGCVFRCSLCGGNWEAQRAIFNRIKPILRPIDSVIGTIREAMEYGHKTFYFAFDADPSGFYYSQLFARIRREGLRIRAVFEPWGLPSHDLIDGLANTFEDAMLVMTADSGDEAIRKIHKGPLSYSNAELRDRLQHAKDRGLATQLFFGFFLPDDSESSILCTRAFMVDCAHEYGCETLYMDFSTDPGSPVFLYPDRYRMRVNLHSLQDYLDALGRERITVNMVEHRPRAMSQKTMTRMIIVVNLEQLMEKVFPVGMRALFDLSSDERSVIHELVDSFLIDFARRHADPKREFVVAQVLDALCARVEQGDVFGERAPLVRDLLRFEAAPFLLWERHFTSVGVHYSRTVSYDQMSDEEVAREATAGRLVSDTFAFDYDLPAFVPALKTGVWDLPPRSRTELRFHVHRSGRCSMQEL